MPQNNHESTYDRIRKERCEWCRTGIPSYLGLHYRGDYGEVCTAPSRDQVIEEQAAEIERLKADKERLTSRQMTYDFAEWVIGHYRHGIRYEIGDNNLRVAARVIAAELNKRLNAAREAPHAL